MQLVSFEKILSKGVKDLLPWIPTISLAKVFWAACASQAPPERIWPSLAIALGYALLFCGLVVWKVRRSDR